MIQISINYDSRWCNSFLDGNNNVPAPADGRKYIASLSNIGKNEDAFICRDISIDTVMGVLNRLIGDQRKLYQSRSEGDYFFRELEEKGLVSFDDKISSSNEEMVYLRNMSGSLDQNSFSGMINSTSSAFNSDYSSSLWAVLFSDLEGLCDFILSETIDPLTFSVDPVVISDRFNSEISKIKNISIENPKIDYLEKVIKAEKKLEDIFQVSYRNGSGESIQVFSLYCSALYLQINTLKEKYDLQGSLSKSGNIPGFSKRGFTFKDFMKAFTTGNGKIVFGNPYFQEKFVKGEGKTKEMLKKASGELIITIDLDREKSQEMHALIKSASVSTFRLGKKGLAYVSNIRVC